MCDCHRLVLQTLMDAAVAHVRQFIKLEEPTVSHYSAAVMEIGQLQLPLFETLATRKLPGGGTSTHASICMCQYAPGYIGAALRNFVET